MTLQRCVRWPHLGLCGGPLGEAGTRVKIFVEQFAIYPGLRVALSYLWVVT